MNAIYFNVKHQFHVREKCGFYAIIALFIIIQTSCAPGGDAENPRFDVDILPPVLQSAEVINEKQLQFVFNEAVEAVKEQSTIDPNIPIDSINSDGKTLNIVFSEEQGIGKNYVIRMEVMDTAGNSLSFLYEFSGWNARVPTILINEIIPRGSKTIPDTVELFCVSAGNLGGIVLKVGSEERPVNSKTFPAIDVKEGEYLVIHAQPEEIAAEVDELDSTSASGGLLARDDARDFWMDKDAGLPGNNGAVVLYRRKGGSILDAVLWSNRVDDLTDEELGWTSESFDWASEIGRKKGWKSAGAIPAPSEAVDVSYSTSTRSLCRNSSSADTDMADDWHTVPTRGHTMGGKNSDNKYDPG